MVLILKLVLAHLIGDFIFQPKSWVKDKQRKKLKSKWLYIHVTLHIALMFLLVFNVKHWALILSIGVAHLAIDAAKLMLQNKSNKRYLFFADQALHLISIIGLTLLFTSTKIQFSSEFTNTFWLLITCLFFLTLPTAFVMKTIFLKWNISKITKGNESLKDAGLYIGILERLLVFTFIIVGHWEAVGFLITAKSVFRFGDLTATKHRKLTEYILIGTLISFGIAIVTGLLYLALHAYV